VIQQRCGAVYSGCGMDADAVGYECGRGGVDDDANTDAAGGPWTEGWARHRCGAVHKDEGEGKTDGRWGIDTTLPAGGC